MKNPYLDLLKTAWKYAREDKLQYVQVYGMFIMSNLLNALLPVIWGLFINELQKQGAGILRTVWLYVGVYLLIQLLIWFFHGVARVKEEKLAFIVGQNFLQELYHKAVHLPVRWHQDNHSGATINRVRKAHESLKGFFSRGFMYIGAVLKFVFSFVAILYFSPVFGLVATVMGVFTIYLVFKFDKPFVAHLKEVNEREHVVSANLFDSLSNIITVITLRLEKRMESGLMEKVRHIFPPFAKAVIINEWKWFVVDMCVHLIYGVILLGYMYQHYRPDEVFLIGGLVTLIGFVNRFTSVFHDVAWQYSAIVRHDTDVKTAQNIIQAYDQLAIAAVENGLDDHWQRIAIRDLNFSHMAEKKGEAIQGLKNVNIRIEKGKKVAIIGESGSGKSTLLSILRGLYEPEPGLRIAIDDQNTHNMALISHTVSLFPQEPEIFENTIEYNITLGLSYEEAQLKAICDAVHFSEVIAQLPKGLQSSIQEKGVNLSGGQKQRLALARGVFAAQDSQIILLDEPTSSVDPKTEVQIYDKMFRLFGNQAVVSALHRLHLLPKFDYIYIMENGEIVDEGTFLQLYAHSAIFQELWKHQEEMREK